MVQTVHHPDTYCCTVCGQEYEDYWRAEFCESFPIIPAPYEIGQTINVQTRYDGIKPVIVSKIELCNYANVLLMVGKTKEDIQRDLAKRDTVDAVQHSYSVTVSEILQLGKDFYSNICRLDDIVSLPS